MIQMKFNEVLYPTNGSQPKRSQSLSNKKKISNVNVAANTLRSKLSYNCDSSSNMSKSSRYFSNNSCEVINKIDTSEKEMLEKLGSKYFIPNKIEKTTSEKLGIPKKTLFVVDVDKVVTPKQEIKDEEENNDKELVEITSKNNLNCLVDCSTAYTTSKNNAMHTSFSRQKSFCKLVQNKFKLFGSRIRSSSENNLKIFKDSFKSELLPEITKRKSLEKEMTKDYDTKSLKATLLFDCDESRSRILRNKFFDNASVNSVCTMIKSMQNESGIKPLTSDAVNIDKVLVASDKSIQVKYKDGYNSDHEVSEASAYEINKYLFQTHRIKTKPSNHFHTKRKSRYFKRPTISFKKRKVEEWLKIHNGLTDEIFIDKIMKTCRPRSRSYSLADMNGSNSTKGTNTPTVLKRSQSVNKTSIDLSNSSKCDVNFLTTFKPIDNNKSLATNFSSKQSDINKLENIESIDELSMLNAKPCLSVNSNIDQTYKSLNLKPPIPENQSKRMSKFNSTNTIINYKTNSQEFMRIKLASALCRAKCVELNRNFRLQNLIIN